MSWWGPTTALAQWVFSIWPQVRRGLVHNFGGLMSNMDPMQFMIRSTEISLTPVLGLGFPRFQKRWRMVAQQWRTTCIRGLKSRTYNGMTHLSQEETWKRMLFCFDLSEGYQFSLIKKRSVGGWRVACVCTPGYESIEAPKLSYRVNTELAKNLFYSGETMSNHR